MLYCISSVYFGIPPHVNLLESQSDIMEEQQLRWNFRRRNTWEERVMNAAMSEKEAKH